MELAGVVVDVVDVHRVVLADRHDVLVVLRMRATNSPYHDGDIGHGVVVADVLLLERRGGETAGDVIHLQMTRERVQYLDDVAVAGKEEVGVAGVESGGEHTRLLQMEEGGSTYLDGDTGDEIVVDDLLGLLALHEALQKGVEVDLGMTGRTTTYHHIVHTVVVFRLHLAELEEFHVAIGAEAEEVLVLVDEVETTHVALVDAPTHRDTATARTFGTGWSRGSHGCWCGS